MQTLKDWILAALVVFAFLVICSIDDGAEEKQRADDDLQAAQSHARTEANPAARDLKAHAAFANHLLALDKVK